MSEMKVLLINHPSPNRVMGGTNNDFKEIIMKDYKKYAKKISEMGKFGYITQEGEPNRFHEVNLKFQLCEPYVIGYFFYVSYSFGKWSIDYSLKSFEDVRVNMEHIEGIKTDKEMYENVKEIINKIREHCGVKIPIKE